MPIAMSMLPLFNMPTPPIGTPTAPGHAGNSTPASFLQGGVLKQVNQIGAVNLVNVFEGVN